MTIGCHEAGRRLQQQADGRLPAGDATALHEHVAGCDTCRAQTLQLAWIAETLRRDRKGPSGPFADRVLRKIAERREVVRPLRTRGPAWALLPAAAALLLAASLVFFAFLRTSAPRSASTEPPRVPVELELTQVEAHTVAVAGDFNEWEAETSKMTRGDDGIWRIRLNLPPGRYQYVFVVDQDQWIADPRASTVVDSGFSGTNSVLDVSL